MSSGGYVLLAYVLSLLLLWGYAASLLLATRKQRGGKSCQSS